MRIYNFFQRVSMYCLAMAVLVIAAGTVYNLSGIGLGADTNYAFLFLFGLLVCVQLILLILGAFRLVDFCQERFPKMEYAITAGLFLGMTLICVVLLCKLHPRPLTDSFDDLDEAMQLLKNGAATINDVHIGTIGIFGNNYLLIILFMFFYRIFAVFGVTDTLRVLETLYVMNLGFILLGIWLTWLIVKEQFGVRSANKALILCVMNPVYYGVLFWVYSLTYSLPIMMAIFYCSIRLYRTKKWYWELCLAAWIGGLVVLGYEIRPTAIFPFAALLCVVPVLVVRHKLYRKAILTGGVMVVVMAAAFSLFSHMNRTYFGEIQDGNYPITYWLSMGSHGNGNLSTNGEDIQLADSFEDGDARKEALARQTIQNYEELGVSGTVDLWFRKTMTTWADGYSSIRLRMMHGENESFLYELIGGNHRQFYQIYSQAYRLALLLGVFVFCGFQLKRGKEIPPLQFVVVLTILGGILFYFFWEAKNIYSAPFLLCMILLAQEGYTRWTGQRLLELRDRSVWTLLQGMYVTLTVLSCVILVHLFQTESIFTYNRINALENTKINSPIHLEQRLEQDFYVNKKFNAICLKAAVSAEEEAISAYRIRLLDADRHLLAEKIFTKEDVEKGQILFDFATVQEDSHYVLVLEKEDPKLGDIYFYTKYTYFLDLYRGSLVTDDTTAYVSDLMMNVIYQETQRYFEPAASRLFVVGYLCYSALAFWFIVQRKRTCCVQTAGKKALS